MLNLAHQRNSPVRSTKSTLSDINVLQLFVSARFQVLFHSPPGVLFTFPSRYCSLSVARIVFSLGKWSSQLPTGFLVSRGTHGLSQRTVLFVYKTFTLFGGSFQSLRLKTVLLVERLQPLLKAVQPQSHNACRLFHDTGLGSSPFARRY